MRQDHVPHRSRTAMWCLAFLLPLPAQSRVIKEAAAAPSSGLADTSLAARAYGAAVLEAVGYRKAGEQLQQALQVASSGGPPITPMPDEPQPQGWLDILAATTLRHSEKLFSTASPSGHAALAGVLEETQRTYEKQLSSAAMRAPPASPCDALLATLTAAYLQLTHPDANHADAPRCASVFQLRLCDPPPPPTAGAAPAAPPTESSTTKAHQRVWYEARLFAAIACAASICTPGPLVRLLAAYAHLTDGRLQSVVEHNLVTHLTSLSLSAASQGEMSTPWEAGKGRETVSGEAAALTRMRLSGIVAGVLEYALHVARVRSSLAVTVLSSCSASLGATGDASSSSVGESCTSLLSCCAKVPQSVAQLLIQLTEECAHYQQTDTQSTPAVSASSGRKGDGEDSSSAASVTLATVHAVQELLFTVALGTGTHHMPNRPVPSLPKRVNAMPEPVIAKADQTATQLVVSTSRAMSLAEADAIAQELFPALVQQLGLEWPWSPLLRHLSSLDKVQPTASSIAETAHAAVRLFPVRWSSHLLLDTILLSLARKAYPQRLLNILPGSFERLLERLDLLPPQPQQRDDAGGDVAVGSPHRSAAATGPPLFNMPAYYAEPGMAVVTYLQRAGVSGVRVEEMERVLATSTSTYAMLVRLRAQAPPRGEGEVGGADDDADGVYAAAASAEKGMTGPEKRAKKEATTYALSRERVRQLISRYEAEVLLAAVVVYTQLRIPSQVQQLMRTLAPLFLKIHLDWRTHHDGSVASWLFMNRGSGGALSADAASDPQAIRFSTEATVLLDKVGYEFYPLEWLPAVTARMAARTTSSASSANAPPSSSNSAFALPYSLCAAVGHQFRLNLRGTPLGSSGYATQCHPAGPRASVVMPSGSDHLSLISGEQESSANDAKASVAAWRRSERFFTGLMQLCYLDTKTSSTELEGTLAVSSTRRVLTTGSGGAGSSTSSAASVGGTHVVAAADVAAHRLRSLLQQPAVMNAMWGSMEGQIASSGSSGGGGSRSATQSRYAAGKGPRFPPSGTNGTFADAETQLRSLQQLLREYGASSFDTTVEAADFALTVAQCFLPCTSGMSTASKGQKRSETLLRSAVEWCRATARLPTDKARINMLLQQQQQQQKAPSGTGDPLMSAYNSVTVDAAWLARSVLRQVPRRIWEKLHVQQAEAHAMEQRHIQWSSRLPRPTATADTMCAGSSPPQQQQQQSRELRRVDPLLWEQWTQWGRVLQQLALVDVADGDVGPLGGSGFPASSVATADDMSCAQWLWYSPFFAAEWA